MTILILIFLACVVCLLNVQTVQSRLSVAFRSQLINGRNRQTERRKESDEVCLSRYWESHMVLQNDANDVLMNGCTQRP